MRSKRQKKSYGCRLASGYVAAKVKNISFKMHRLIMFAFCGLPPEDKQQVNHIDLNRSNNAIENLEYASGRDNITHAHQTNTERKHNGAARTKGVLSLGPGQTTWVHHRNNEEAAAYWGIRFQKVSACALGTRPHTKGIRFKYASADAPIDEEWKTVTSVPNARGAAVSSHGRFRDARGVTKAPCAQADGYVRVQIDRTSHRMHRLIAAEFLDKPSGANDVDHINGDKSDNSVKNLQWVTHSENVQRSHASDRHGNSGIVRSWSIEARRLDSSDWVEYKSACEASRLLGLSQPAISTSIQRKTSHAGFEFRKTSDHPDLEGEVWAPVVVPVNVAYDDEWIA
jgi:hypothetical protein